MKPLDHYRLAIYLHSKKQLESRLNEINAKIERVQYRPHRSCHYDSIRHWSFQREVQSRAGSCRSGNPDQYRIHEGGHTAPDRSSERSI